MGLAGRKQKQRIPADPRNLSWADDASRFGLSYLSKFGWDASQGLGASGEGMKTHIKAQQKLDMMGIGAQHQRDPNGIAWKQNKDFEALLKRLNESVNQEGEIGDQNAKEDDATELEMGINGKISVGPQVEKVEEKSRDDDSRTVVKKRKHRDGAHPDSDENTRKKRKKEKNDRRQRSDSDISSDPAVNPNPVSVSTQSGSHSDLTSKPRPMAHRARIRAAKRIADKSASAISEILGIAPSSSVSTSTPTPVPTLPPSPTPDSQSSSLSLDNLTTSAKSVADYFKEKLLACSTTSSALPSTPRVLSGSATPGLGATRLGTGSSHTFPSEEGEPQRKGIGSQVLQFSQMSEPGSVSGNGDDNANSEDTATEKMRRKAERKAEKRKRREAEADQPISKGSVKQVEGGRTKSVEKTSKEKKKKKGQEQHQHARVDSEGITEKDHRHNTGGPSPELKKKSKKLRQTKCL